MGWFNSLLFLKHVFLGGVFLGETLEIYLKCSNIYIYNLSDYCIQ